MKRITVLLLCLSALSCCTERRISRDLKTFMGETITVPSDLVRIVDGKTSVCGQMPAVPVMVFYHDSLSCSSCQISHLADIQSIYELSDSLGTFEVMTIFSPGPEEYD